MNVSYLCLSIRQSVKDSYHLDYNSKHLHSFLLENMHCLDEIFCPSDLVVLQDTGVTIGNFELV